LVGEKYKRADLGNPVQFTLRLWTENSFSPRIWFSLWSKIGDLPCSHLKLERVTVSAAILFLWSSRGAASGLSLQPKSNVNDLFFGQH